MEPEKEMEMEKDAELGLGGPRKSLGFESG